MHLPQAHVSHRSPTRIRLKIFSRRGDAPYFEDLQRAFDKAHLADSVTVNPLTGSVLLVGDAVDLDAISTAARDRGLFELGQDGATIPPVAHYVSQPLHHADGVIAGVTGGYLNLTGSLLLVLVGVGIYDLLKGGLRMPPWYTAFWYAFGLFSLLAVEKAVTRP